MGRDCRVVARPLCLGAQAVRALLALSWPKLRPSRYAVKRWQTLGSHAPTPCKGRRRVQKHGPVFMSNLYGSKTVVVADFAGWEKVRRCGAVQLRQACSSCLSAGALCFI